ncbi:MAG: 4-(cytidine 5'-diphospho)-2-C-methyl-D-erythritol kinase [Clostridia bacterium]|nr:4-(cytidine 5'-diphospho)-2-C-methyl-D-erythritol kinase [Clostridia bacterium]
MKRVFTGKAYGKINLHLDVLDRMENGYHNIESVMQSVSLCDTVTLELEDISGKCEIIIKSSSQAVPCNKTNLVYKCAKKLIDYTGTTGKRCTFTIEKNIPVSAGMAGGSSDGACAMKLLNEALGGLLSHSQLCALGATVGADIPFCLTGGTCICRGIGDKITPIKSFGNIRLISAIDYSSVSTPVAFSLLDDKYGTDCASSRDISKIVDAIEAEDVGNVASLLYNKFEDVIIPINQNVEKIKRIMLENGAVGTLMSGSGPSVFGVFLDGNSQNKALSALENCSINAFFCKTL